MMILKARGAFNKLFPRMNVKPEDRINIKKLADNLEQGEYLSGHNIYLLREKSYRGLSHYDQIPKQCRFYISEYSFCSTRFTWGSFYDFQTPKEEIYADYCKLFLENYPNKSIERFYKKLKKENPEIFI